MRHCMTEERLTSLAHIMHYDGIVKMFAHMHPRRLEMDNILLLLIH